MSDSKLAQTQAVTQLATHLYDYLPGSSPSQTTYTFLTAATKAGVADFWTPGSKGPALTELLDRTLTHRRASFCPLMEAIVHNGLKYRTRRGNPLTRGDIETLNSLITKVGFKLPELWDPTFLSALPDAPGGSAAPVVQTPPLAPSIAQRRETALLKLRPELDALYAEKDRQAAGLRLEGLLNALFSVFDLDPRPGFRVVGEQIDGSFVLDRDVYLLEAKWEKGPTDAKELYAFRAKVEGKSSFTRGLFLSMNDFTRDALDSFNRGKQPNFFLMNGVDLYDIVCGQMAFDELLRGKARHLAEAGEALISARALYERMRR